MEGHMTSIADGRSGACLTAELRTEFNVGAELLLIAHALFEQALREAQVVRVLDLLPEQLLLALPRHRHRLISQAVLQALQASCHVCSSSFNPLASSQMKGIEEVQSGGVNNESYSCDELH
jgi:hypothetical protein